MILVAVEASDEQLVEQMRANALWGQLDAVRSDQVHTVDGQLWLLGGSALAGQALIAELRAVFDL